MKLLMLVPVLLLSACSSVPITVKFPDAAPSIQESCADLQQIPPPDKLSEIMLTITANYGLYHECQLKVEAWKDWHKQQKEIFETLK